MLSKPWFLTGVFLISFANLLFELLLVRITSVTLAPQTAFVVISIVMCGMTIGALVVFLLPRLFRIDRTESWLSMSALFFAITDVAAIWNHLQTRFGGRWGETAFLPFTIAYATLLLPFVASGICICLALARYPQKLAKTYAADLCGAAFACLALPVLLAVFDAVTACIFVACLAALSSLAFALGTSKRLVASSLIVATLFFGFSLFNFHSHLMKVEWRRGIKDTAIAFESWNSYSRIIQTPPDKGLPFYWSMSSSAPLFLTETIYMALDSMAGTCMPAFDGDLKKLAYLKFDAVNAGLYLRDNANALVIGVGGGRDVLSALVFGARAVTGVDINQTMIDLLKDRCSNFNQVARNPNVHLVNEDGRTFLSRTKERFDFIHISQVDTYAATASGALVFSENSIYTVEAWRLVLERLSNRGIFCFSYWYPDQTPLFRRFVYTAAAALRSLNIDSPRRHMILVLNKRKNIPNAPKGTDSNSYGTLLVCRSPFSRQDLNNIRDVAARLNYKIVFDPEQADSAFDGQTLAKLDPAKELDRNFRFTPPTDDCPFPFCCGPYPWREMFVNPEGIPLVVSLSFAIGGILLPLVLMKRKFSFVRGVPLIIYFAAIGLGFIFFELSQMQRLSIFLGHPTLSLTVILGTLLFASGLGSFLIQTAGLAHLARNPRVILLSLVLGLLLYQLVSSLMVELLSASGVTVKILTTIAVISPIGILLGMALPLGMDRVSAEDNQMIAWMWGINGAASVLGSVAAVLFAMHIGISFVYTTVIACYGIALACTMAWGKRSTA
jgi:SAM-dependent methyltransferase